MSEELSRDARDLLEMWALCQLGGRLRSVGIHEAKDESDGVDDGFRQWRHVEQFWDQGRNRQFRSMALEVFGKHAVLEDWVWYLPWEPRFRSCLRHGWGWVCDTSNPIPEVWSAFVTAFRAWMEEHPLPAVAAIVEQKAKGDPAKLVSIRTASEVSGVPLPTLQAWCRTGKVQGAIKFGDWAIPLSVAVTLERRKRGRPISAASAP